MSNLRPVDPATERAIITSVISVPAPTEPAIATSDGYRLGLQQMRRLSLHDQGVRAQLIRRGLL